MRLRHIPSSRIARRSVFMMALTSAGVLWMDNSTAQFQGDLNPLTLNESVLSAVINARRLNTEANLQSIAAMLTANAQPIENRQSIAYLSGLKLPPAAGGSYGEPLREKSGTAGSFGALPDRIIGRSNDGNNIPIAYCAYDPQQVASTGRYAGSASLDSLAFAVISAGANGRFEYTCDDLFRNQNLPNSDDVSVRVINRELAYNGQQLSHMGSPVNTYASLSQLRTTAMGVSEGQVRMVRDLNQFFIASTDANGNVNWSPLTPTALLSNGSENRADFRWMSGAIGIGANSISGRPATVAGTVDASSRSTLTLGNVSSNAAGSAIPDNRAVGISLLDDRSILRTYVGLSGTEQTAFSIRHINTQGAVNERFRISSDGRLWLGDVPLSEMPSLPSGAASTVYSILSGDMQLGSGIASIINGGRIGRVLYIGDTMAGQNAFMRAMESNSSSGLVPVLMLGMQNAVTGGLGSGHILFNTTGNVGIGFDGLSLEQIPAATLDVNGSVRVRNGLLLESKDIKPMTLKSTDRFNFGNEIVIDSTISDSTQIATIGMGNGFEEGERQRNFYINVNNADRLSINKLGDIGIGTNIPQARMEIVGVQDRLTTPTFRIRGANGQTADLMNVLSGAGALIARIDSVGNITANNGLNVNNTVLNANAGLNVSDFANFSRGVRLTASLADAFSNNVIQGNAGSMHVTSEFGLHVVLDNNNNNTGSDFAFTVGRGGYLSNAPGYSEMMRVNAVGNMGLGTATPAARLDIVGTQSNLPLLRATAMSGQTADLFQLNSATSSVPLFKVDANGNLSGRAAEFSGAVTAQGATLLHDLVLSPASMGLNEGIGIYFKDPDGGTGPASIVYRDTGTPELEISSRLKVLGLLTANNGLNVNNAALNANGGLAATTGAFSGLLTANNGLNVNNAVLNANSGLTATTGTFSGLLTANNGLNVNNEVLNANAGLNSTTGFFSTAVGIGTTTVGEGLALDVNGKTRITNALGIGTLPANDRALDVVGNANISGTLGVGGRLTASGGLSTTTGTFSDVLAANGGLGATSGTFSQLLRADGGLTGSEATFTNLLANTGSFKQSLNTDGNMTIGGNLSVAGLANLNGGLNVTGNSTFNGTLTVNGKIAGLNTVAMQFFGYSGPNNSNPAPIGNATLDINTGAVQIFLAQANPNLYSIDQNLSSGNTPTFNGMRLNSGGLSSSGVISTSSSFQGYLDGTARDANKLNKTLRFIFTNPHADLYREVDINLADDSQLIVREIPLHATLYMPPPDQGFSTDNRSYGQISIGSPNFSNITVTCNNTFTNGTKTSGTCSLDRNLEAQVTVTKDPNLDQGLIPPNTYNYSPSVSAPQSIYNVTNQVTGTSSSSNYATTAGTANQLASPVNLRVKGDFINDASVSFQSGGVVDLTLSSKGLNHAKNMNQDVKTDSTVTFNLLTAAQARINGDISANSIQVQGPATVRSLSVVNSGGSTNIRLDGETNSANIGFITLNGSDNSVTATRFIGTADKATRLAQDLAFNFQGVISGTTSTSNGFNYTINTSIGPGAITNDMIKELHGSKLTGLSVDTAQLATGAVKTDKIFDGAVTADKLGIDAVITDKIKNEAVTTNKLAPDAVIFKARNLESSSDIRLKHNISRVDGNSLLQRLSQTLLYGYQFNNDPEQKRQLGVIAQELQPLFPELVTVQKDGADAGFFAVNYGVLGAVAAAGVGELNRKLDALGLRMKNATTVEASLPTFAVTRIEGVNARFEKLEADEITAKTARFEKLDAQQFVTDKSRSKQLQADTLNSGSTEGFGMGGGLMLFSAVQDGHYLVQVSAADGSHATASVFVSGGVVSVVPVGGSDISIAASAGTVYAVGPGKHMKASWLKTG